MIYMQQKVNSSFAAPISVFPLSLNDEEIDVMDLDESINDEVIDDGEEEKSGFQINGCDDGATNVHLSKSYAADSQRSSRDYQENVDEVVDGEADALSQEGRLQTHAD